jgi:TrmH family RNA methyltransferase
MRALRRDAALRRSEGVFLAEGTHLVREALSCGAPIEVFLHSPALLDLPEGPALLRDVRARGLPCHETGQATLAAVCEARTPQPVACLVRHEPLGEAEASRLLDRATLAVLLDGIQDPGNLGSILRSADGAGCDVCLVGPGSADPFHPRAVRATMGSVFRLPVLQEPCDDALDRLARHGFRVLGADPHRGVEYDRAVLEGKLALVFGGEGAGMGQAVRGRLDGLLRIPLRDGVESLSVAAAAAVVLFEVARQRRR